MHDVHVIDDVIEGSIAESLGIIPGDSLLSVNGEEIEDIFDYQYLCESDEIKVLIRHADGEESEYEIVKDEDDDLGLVFDGGLMDDYRHCSNKCIFCFIDQMPKGMRETLYFKDDDSRLSFLQGNYITLTNMSDHDIDRIIKYRLSPINVSFQTMNPELRCKMLNNRFAGTALDKVRRLVEAGITLNGQIVLCKGINDGDELEYSLSELYKFLPVVESVSVVPVGLTKYRDGLPLLEAFDSDDAVQVIDTIERWQKKAYDSYGLHFVHASDEWYILAGRELPEEDRYDGYLQIENGVGMVRSMLTEYEEAMMHYEARYSGVGAIIHRRPKKEHLVIITGLLAYPYIKDMADRLMQRYPMKTIEVAAIRNDYFGEKITVAGLVTATDIIAQCKEKGYIGIDRMLIPECMLRAESDVFLDDLRIADVEAALGTRLEAVATGGYSFVEAILNC